MADEEDTHREKVLHDVCSLCAMHPPLCFSFYSSALAAVAGVGQSEVKVGSQSLVPTLGVV